MYINYFLPIFKENNAKNFLESFLKTEFCKQNKNYKMIFCCNKTDKENLKHLKNKNKTNKKIKIVVLEKEFSYNDAFESCVKEFDGDILLLGDLNIEKLDLVFQKCLEKHKNGAKVVHVVKKRRGIKGFFINMFQSIYNFFVKIFTNKKDRLNVVSLGLIDKDILDLLKVLPQKRCFLKNTKNIVGFDTRTIYISDKTKTYRPNFKQTTQSLLISKISAIAFFVSLLLIIGLNCFLKMPSIINIFLILFAFLGLVSFSMFLPKHIFDIRNKPSINNTIKKEK